MAGTGRANDGVNARLRGSTALFLVSLALPGAAYAGPKGGIVIGGDANISQSGAVTTIDQGSNSAIINWKNFDVGASETVNFNQPSAQSITLNRVGSKSASQIDGRINANGNVWIVNPNGVLIGETATVNTNGFIATSADIDNDRFMQGDHSFDQAGAPDAVVVNKGKITFGEAGLVGLVAPSARNDGAIVGKMGKVVVAGAETFAVDMAGDGILALQAGDTSTLAVNTGQIETEAGYVVIEAAAAEASLEAHVDAGGVIEATGFEIEGGRITLSGETVTVSGTLDASASGADGGDITVTGDRIELASTAKVDASGENGGRIRIGGDYQGGGTLRRASETRAAAGATLRADGGNRGDGGRIIVWSDSYTGFFGQASVTGGQFAGDGGLLEVSGGLLKFDQTPGLLDVTALNGDPGKLLLDPRIINIQNTGLNTDGGYIDPIGPPGGNIDYGDAGQYLGETNITPEFITSFNGDLVLQATDQININDTVDNTNAGTVTNLTLQSGGNIVFNADLRLNGSIRLEAGYEFEIAPTVASLGIDLNYGSTVEASNDLTLSLGTGQSLYLYDGASLISGGALALPDTEIYGTATVTSNGTLSQQAGTTIREVAGETSDSATLVANAGTGDILLNNAGNGLSTIQATGASVTIVHDSTQALASEFSLLGVTATGDLSVTTDAGLNITQDLGVTGAVDIQWKWHFGRLRLVDHERQSKLQPRRRRPGARGRDHPHLGRIDRTAVDGLCRHAEYCLGRADPGRGDFDHREHVELDHRR